MATATVDACQICANSFNSDFYRSVSLPCGHDFCLLCLVRLKASGSHQCPVCRCNWAGFEVPALPGMEALTAPLQADQGDDGFTMKKKSMLNDCEQHSRHYEYWAVDVKAFYCAKCVAKNPPTKLELIEDAIPQIKAALAPDVSHAKKKVENVLESLDEMHAKLVRNRNYVKEFMKAVQALDDNFKRDIEQNVERRSMVLDTADKLNSMEKNLNSFKSPVDVHVAMECKSTLKIVAASSSFPTSDLPQTLLCNIARSYVEEAATVKPPPMASLVNAVLKGSLKPLLDIVRATEQLWGGQKWCVDYNNCDSALLALADRQPSLLTLIARDDAPEPLPLAAFAKAARGCEVDASFVDTFYSATNTATDVERLEQLTGNQSLRLVEFFGHLDHSAIAKLPHTITTLGLAIGSAADAAAVSGLRLWKGLNGLRVSVSSRVAVEDLGPLPSGPDTRLYFPFLSDNCVDSVRPAITALVPDLRLYWIRFAKCQLTTSGARRLMQQLMGIKISCEVAVEACGAWQPGAEEKTSFAAQLVSATGCNFVRWNVGWS